MSKKMLIDASHPEESRVAILEDGVLQELDIETTAREQIKGNIYKAFVVKVEPGLQAAFVDYGGNRHGFISLGDIQNKYFKWREGADRGKRPRIQDVIHKGAELLVQVVKGERDNKGASLTTDVSLPGRYMVLMPGSDTAGISRKIESEEQRKKIKEMLEGLDVPEGFGVIVRTAGLGRTKQEIARDFQYLMKLWETIETTAAQVKAPSLIYREYDMAIRMVRDYFTPEIDEILIDNKDVFKRTKDFFTAIMPRQAKIVKLYQERRPIFSKYQTEEQIERIYDQRVPLKSGGSIVIMQTEALVAIDVNSGKGSSEKGVEETAFRANVEAAEEVARQLRLRDMGGLIVIDFIDMMDRKNRQEVEKTLKNAFKADKARVQVSKISEFGLLELSRQRIKPALTEGSYLPCPHCESRGAVKSSEAAALAALRKLHAQAAKKEFGLARITLPAPVASYLLNQKRYELVRLESDYGMRIVVLTSEKLLPAQSVLETERFSEGRAEGAETQEAARKVNREREDRRPEWPSEKKAAVTGAMEMFLKESETDIEEEPETPEAGAEIEANAPMEEEDATEQASETGAETPMKTKRSRRGRRGRRKGRSSEGEARMEETAADSAVSTPETQAETEADVSETEAARESDGEKTDETEKTESTTRRRRRPKTGAYRKYRRKGRTTEEKESQETTALASAPPAES